MSKPETRPVTGEVPGVKDPNTYIDGRSFDWSVYHHGDGGERVLGGVGACGQLDRAIARVDEELAQYVITAHATITETVHLRKPERRLVARAIRDERGEVSWTWP